MAVIAVANKLIRQAFAVFTHRKPYVDGFELEKNITAPEQSAPTSFPCTITCIIMLIIIKCIFYIIVHIAFQLDYKWYVVHEKSLKKILDDTPFIVGKFPVEKIHKSFVDKSIMVINVTWRNPEIQELYICRNICLRGLF